MTKEAPNPTARDLPGSTDPSPFAAVRRLYVEDELAAAVARGVTQYVVLGAKQDTYAYIDAHPGLRVFVAAGFAEESLCSALKNEGFDVGEISFFSWLGAPVYATAEAVMAALGFIGSLPAGTSVLFDYAVERPSLDSMEQFAMDPLASRVETACEPVRLFLNPSALHGMLRAAGFRLIQDLGPNEIDSLYSASHPEGQRSDAGVAHLVNARV